MKKIILLLLISFNAFAVQPVSSGSFASSSSSVTVVNGQVTNNTNTATGFGPNSFSSASSFFNGVRIGNAQYPIPSAPLSIPVTSGR